MPAPLTVAPPVPQPVLGSPDGALAGARPYFLTYQDPPPLFGDSKLYRVYRDPDALLFIHLGLHLPGLDYRGMMSSSGEAMVLAAGAGLVIAGLQSLTAKVEAPKLKARLEAVERMTPTELRAEAAQKPNLLAGRADMADVEFGPWDGYKGAWATARDGEVGACLRFRHSRQGKVKLNFQNREDLQTAVGWVRELMGVEAVRVKFPTG